MFAPCQTTVWLAVALAQMSCGQTGATDTDCDSYTVTPDGGITGFTHVGETRTGSVCAEYCEKSHKVCQLLSGHTVKCQIPCG